MKKFFALLLVVLMLVPFVVACNGDDDTTTAPKTDATTTAPNNDNTTTAPTPAGAWSSKYDVRTTWSGKTLHVACSTWSGSAGAPWSVMELCIDYGKTSGFGEKIDAAVLERQEFIKETYGVDLDWILATRFGMHDALEQAFVAGNVVWDLCLPRAMRSQQIVAGGYIYDLAGREFIDFDNTYYNDLSVKNYTAKGHTFFLTGDFSNLDKETASVVYFNKNLLGDAKATTDLYKAVREGKWTWSMLMTLANGSYSDDGDGVHGDTDTYGLSLTSITNLYRFFGVLQAGANASTGEWEITLDDPKVDDIVAAIISANTANWCRYSWDGSYGSNAKEALRDGRLLFYNEVIQHSDVGTYGDMGIAPFPMLNEEQGRYYAPCADSMYVVMCVPKITQDRNMADYFIDVLAWTGKEYTMEAYLDGKRAQFDSEVEIEMITEYIFPNVVYDVGAAVGWGSLIGGVLSDSFKGNVNNFTQAFEAAEPGALQTIANWNNAWGAYTEA